MCFVLDTNSFHRLFDSGSIGHDDFVPLLNWLYRHPGTSLVYGGSSYRKELGHMRKYFGTLVELKRARKISEVSDQAVDGEEARIKSQVDHRDFDDPHIVAIFSVSGCMLFASCDKRADKFIKLRRLLPKGQKRPRIYRSRKHAHLLCNRNIVKLRNVL